MNKHTVDEGDEPPCHVLAFKTHLGYIHEEYGVEGFGDLGSSLMDVPVQRVHLAPTHLDIVCSAHRLATEVVEAEFGHTLRRLGHDDLAAPGLELAVEFDGVLKGVVSMSRRKEG